mmetsp:Transcript_23282/g.45202  ORF Transcript_23282/g.45202 Transcript_23282/m.45202 type:complete len:204 (-) Transcript_23282:966-1577(-)
MSPLHTRTSNSFLTCFSRKSAISLTRSSMSRSSWGPDRCRPSVFSSICCLTRTALSSRTSISPSTCCSSFRCFCLMVPMALNSCPTCTCSLPSSSSLSSHASVRQSTASSYLPCALCSSEKATCTDALRPSGLSPSPSPASHSAWALSSIARAAWNLPRRVSQSPMPSRMRQWRFCESASLPVSCALMLSAVLKCCSACTTSF